MISIQLALVEHTWGLQWRHIHSAACATPPMNVNKQIGIRIQNLLNIIGIVTDFYFVLWVQNNVFLLYFFSINDRLFLIINHLSLHYIN